MDRIAKHESVCKGTKKRRVFQSGKQRLAGMDGVAPVKVARGGGTRRGGPGRSALPKKTNWRAQHQEFQAMLRANRGGGARRGGGFQGAWSRSHLWRRTDIIIVSCNTIAGFVSGVYDYGGGGSRSPPPPAANTNYVKCPHCHRSFAPATAERHIPKCKNTLNRPKGPPSVTTRRTSAEAGRGVPPPGRGRPGAASKDGSLDYDGKYVTLTGLTGRADLNGERGWVTLYDEKAGRYHVELELGETVALKPANLTLTGAKRTSAKASVPRNSTTMSGRSGGRGVGGRSQASSAPRATRASAARSTASRGGGGGGGSFGGGSFGGGGFDRFSVVSEGRGGGMSGGMGGGMSGGISTSNEVSRDNPLANAMSGRRGGYYN